MKESVGENGEGHRAPRRGKLMSTSQPGGNPACVENVSGGARTQLPAFMRPRRRNERILSASLVRPHTAVARRHRPPHHPSSLLHNCQGTPYQLVRPDHRGGDASSTWAGRGTRFFLQAERHLAPSNLWSNYSIIYEGP